MVAGPANHSQVQLKYQINAVLLETFVGKGSLNSFST